MSSEYGRQCAGMLNEFHQSLGALLGITQGFLADRHLANEEIQFLQQWLANHTTIRTVWPGDVIYQRVQAVMADGIVTEEERAHLADTLQSLVGGTLKQLADETHVTQLLPFETPQIGFASSTFCLTGNFVFAPRKVCENTITMRGGSVKSSPSNKLNFLVIGGLGSPEWKHGSFGTKIEAAMRMKREGAAIAIVHEDHWASSLRG